MGVTRFAIFAAAIAFTTPAMAAKNPFPPTHDKICSKMDGKAPYVDRVKLADYLLMKYPLSIRAMPKTASPGDTDVGLFILGHIDDICSGATVCSAADQTAKNDLNGAVLMFLSSDRQKESYRKPEHLTAAAYFLPADGEAPEIQCLYDGAAAINPPGASLGEPEKIVSNVRVHGKVDDLYIDRDDDTFKTSSPAVLSFASDAVAGKSTETLTGVIGYSIPIKRQSSLGDYTNLIPYLQINHAIVKPTPGSTAKASATDTYSLGAMTSFYFRSGNRLLPTGNFFNIRPDYLVNRVDKSAIASLNFQYVPIVNQRVNSFIDGFSPFLYKWVFDVRVDAGTYTDRGHPEVAEANKDYLRAGGQFGIALVTRSDQLPMSLSSTYTSLYSLRGDIDIGYFANAFTYYLDPKKYVGLTLTYTNGRREDTAKREQQVSAGLSSKF